MVLTASAYSIFYFRSVSRRQPRPGDSVMGRVAFQCDVLMMVLHESNPGFPVILPSYLMAVNFTTFDLPAYI